MKVIQTTIKSLTTRINLPSLRVNYPLFNSYISRTRLINRTGVGASLLLGLLLLLVITPLYNVTGVEDSEAATSYTPSESSITFSTSRNTATISGAPTTSGTFISSADAAAQVASFNVTTNNATGYTLSIASNKSDTSLTNGSTTLSALTANTTTNAGITATTFNSDTYNNMWGYMPSRVGSSDNAGTNAKFYPMTSTARTLDATSAANSTANNYTIKLGARINYAQVAGEYKVASGTKFELTAVGNPANYNITYNQNTADTVSNLPSSTGTMSTTSQSIALSSNSVSRSGYNFLGYCTVATADQRDDVTGPSACSSVSGTYYAKGADFYINETTANITNLYAIWGLAVTNLGNLQGLAYSSCTASLSKATDTRDGNVYYIQRLADGNCWMLDNLRLDLVNTSLSTLQGKTNATNTELAYLKNGGGTTSDRYATGGVQSNMNYNYSVPYINASYKDTTTTGYGNGSKKIGVYYNYCAASAGTYCYGNGTSYGSPSGNATADICPSGWRMPTGGSSGEYQALYAAYSSNVATFRAVLSTPLSGIFDNGSVNGQGSYGDFWSSTYANATNMYRLRVDSSYVGPQNSLSRLGGFSVRCILTPSYNITISISGGASGVVINGTTYTNGQTASLQKGREYTISGVYDSNYEFSSWSVGSGGTLGSASSASTTLTITSATTLTLAGKSSAIAFQNATSANCGQNMYDNRGTDEYKSIIYTTKKIGSLCWMTRNLDLPGGTALSSSDTNLSSGFILPASSTSGFNSYNTDYVYNSGRTTCSNNSSTGSCYSYYSWYTATAHWGTNSVSSGSSSVDICPKGWRLPTQAEFNTLVSSYSTGSSLVSNWSAVYSGTYYSNSFEYGGSAACYWSSTAERSNSAHNLVFGNSSASVTNSFKYYGYAIRCVAKS